MNVNSEWYIKYYYGIIGTSSSLFLLYILYQHTRPKIDNNNGNVLIMKRMPMKLFLWDLISVLPIGSVMNTFWKKL
jgi:hypothetical protein